MGRAVIMNKEMLLFIQSIADERGVDKEVIFEAVEAALAVTAAKRYSENSLMRVAIDRKSGDYETFRRWEVVADELLEEQEFPEQVIALSKAQAIDADLVVGDFVEEPVENPELRRIGAQQAKQ